MMVETLYHYDIVGRRRRWTLVNSQQPDAFCPPTIGGVYKSKRAAIQARAVIECATPGHGPEKWRSRRFYELTE